MFLVQANEIEFWLKIATVSPLLIRDGRLNKLSRDAWLKPILKRITSDDDRQERRSETPSAVPVCRDELDELRDAVTKGVPLHNVNALQFYIPGSSLRGVWRSYLESQLRGYTAADRPAVCDPLCEAEEPLQSCSKVLTDLVDGEDDGEDAREETADLVPYRVSCPVCRLFGNTHQGGRLSISDGDRCGTEGQIVSREHISIDRKSGKVSDHGPYKFFGLKGAQFDVRVKVVNFELWQLRLLASLFRDAEEGLVPLGSCKSKGYGKNTVAVERMDVTYFGRGPFDGRLYGVAEHPNHGAWFQQRYGVRPTSEPPILPSTPDGPTPWRKGVSVEGKALAEILKELAELPVAMDDFHSLGERRAVGGR